MRNSKYFTFSDVSFITFAASQRSAKKVKKEIKVKGYVRKGKFVRSASRKQEVNDHTALKVAGASLAILAGVLGTGVAGAAITKIRYNKNLIDFGKKIASGTDDIPDMKIPEGLKKIKAPYHVQDKDSLTFFMGGLSRPEVAEGEKFMKTVRAAFTERGKKLQDRHELIPLFHNHQIKRDVDLKFLGKQLETNMITEQAQATLDVFKKAAVKGYNEDSLIMAKEIYKWHKANEGLPINIITASAGGFQGRDVPHILKAAGVDPKLMKVFSQATPDYGLVDEVVPTLKVMHDDDMYSKLIPTTKVLGLPSLHRGTTFVGKGDADDFRKLYTDRGEPLPPPYEMPAVVHFSPAYFNGKTKSSQKTLKLLENFMFND